MDVLRTSSLKHCCLLLACKDSTIARLDFGVKMCTEFKSQKLVSIVGNSIME